MFIQTEATPNPATLKFLPGRAVMPDGTLDLRDVADAERSPLAQRLFGVSGVSGVFLGSDFITVTKSDGEWPHLKPAILGAIMEHFMSGAPVLAAGSAAPVSAGNITGNDRKSRTPRATAAARRIPVPAGGLWRPAQDSPPSQGR